MDEKKGRLEVNRKGFSLVEVVIVMVLFGAMTAIAVPKMRPSNQTRTRFEARLVSRDLEMVRAMAMARKEEVRVAFETDAYSIFVSDSLVRREALADGIQFSSDGASEVSGFPVGSLDELQFDALGIPLPRGTRGVLYLSHEDGDGHAAVSVAGSGSFKVWSFIGGVWQ